jgi:4-hydroxy-tetrahydrodipicolinate reductase
MRLAIVGYGKMGRELERLAPAFGVRSIEIFDIDTPLADNRADSFDVAIDFTTPEAAVQNIKWLARHGKQIVVGTTGWYAQKDDVQKIVAQQGIGLVYSPNFTIGVYLFLRIVRAAAQEYQAFPEFDIAVRETHHAQKVDAPSGTALRIGETILNEWHRKRQVFTGALSGKLPADALQISSARLGTVAGEHTVTIDSASDSIALTHTAKNRSGFATGALRAAAWIQGKKGLFTMDDMMNDLMRPIQPA